MKFSLRLNNDLSPSQYVALAQAAEDAGFDQFWVSNDLFLRSDIPILTQVALRTERIHVGTGILNPYTIHPVGDGVLAATHGRDQRQSFPARHRRKRGTSSTGWDQAGSSVGGGARRRSWPCGLLPVNVTLDGKFLRWNDEPALRFDRR
ncbi:MAG: LLM class flavin-dependent oxidoreductase [Caldilineaceae bacterium]